MRIKCVFIIWESANVNIFHKRMCVKLYKNMKSRKSRYNKFKIAMCTLNKSQFDLFLNYNATVGISHMALFCYKYYEFINIVIPFVDERGRIT